MRKARWIAVLATAVGMTMAAAVPGVASAAGVLVVGDSLAEGSSPYLDEYLGPDVELTINAVGGSNSYEILDLFEESYDPSMSVIVFDAGTNDNPNYPEILEENLAKMAATVEERCVVVPTVHGYTVEGADNRGKNRVVHAFAASRPGTQVPDWATIANTRPDLMQEDGLHPSEEGAQVRARLIAEGIEGCLNGAASYLPAPIDAGPLAEGETGGEGTEASASALAAAAVEPVELEQVGKMAKRERALMRDLASGVLPRVAALAVVAAALR